MKLSQEKSTLNTVFAKLCIVLKHFLKAPFILLALLVSTMRILIIVFSFFFFFSKKAEKKDKKLIKLLKSELKNEKL